LEGIEISLWDICLSNVLYFGAEIDLMIGKVLLFDCEFFVLFLKFFGLAFDGSIGE